MMLNKRIANANIIITSIFFIFILVTKVFANDLGTLKQYSDLLLISNNVYDTSPSDEGSDAEITPFGIPTDKGNSYTIAKVFTDPESGFDASIYVDQNGKAVVAFRGTEFSFSDLNDIETDLQILQRNGYEEEQYSAVREAMDFASNNFSDITVTGHSLGGSLAQYASLYSGANAVTFNSAPITTNSEALSYVVKPAGLYQSGTSPFKNNPSNIVNISSANDPMTLLNLLVEEVGKGGDPVDLYVALRRSKNPLFPTPHSTIERAKIRVSAYALVTLAQKYYGVDGVGVTSVIVGNRVRLESTTGHSISNLEVQYGELKQEEFLAGLLDDLTPHNYLAPYTPPEEGYIFEYVEFNSAPEENPIASHLAFNPNLGLTDDEIADLVEEAEPDGPVTPDPVLVGTFSGVSHGIIASGPNVGQHSNFVIQSPLEDITRDGSGDVSFEIPAECVSGCTIIGSPPNSDSSSYQYLSWGTLNNTVRYRDANTDITHDIENMRWLIGDTTSPDYLNSRTGTASYAGQIYGDFVDYGLTSYGTVAGEIGLRFNFANDTLSGEGYFALNGVPLDPFTVSGGLLSYSGQQYLQASLTGVDSPQNTGGLLGTFYGPEATEIGGSIWYFGGDYAYGGVFVAQPGSFELPDIGGHVRVTTNKAHFGVYDADGGGAGNGDIQVHRYQTDGTVTPIETFSTAGYSYTSWGSWSANGSTHTDYSEGGYWSSTETTPASVVQNRTGSASYSGNIVGDFVSNGGVRDDARGLININADFSNQSVSGQFQFGHDCGGGSGPSGCNVTSGVASFNEAINDYEGAGFGDHTSLVRTAGSGVVGIFAGPNAEEIAGTAWMNDNGGMYNGVFIAGQ